MSDLPASYWAEQCRAAIRKAKEQQEEAEPNPDPAAHRGTTEQETL